MTRFCDEEELKGALVVDSEGLIYGRASSIVVEDDGVKLEVRSENARDRKGVIPTDEIECIAGGSEIVLVLNTRREASYRGLPSKEPMYQDLRDVKGKLVVSLSGSVLGRVLGVVVGPGEPGIRVGESVVNWIRLVRGVKRRDVKLGSRLENALDPLKSPKISREDAEAVLGELGVEEDISSYVEKGTTRDIPWSRILKIGDVVLVR